MTDIWKLGTGTLTPKAWLLAPSQRPCNQQRSERRAIQRMNRRCRAQSQQFGRRDDRRERTADGCF
ncbi:MAG: hypothetical protein K9L88_04045 [Chromatiaceae bacterium]|nr:hypothetical protein [Chromatiaceae bacterium]